MVKIVGKIEDVGDIEKQRKEEQEKQDKNKRLEQAGEYLDDTMEEMVSRIIETHPELEGEINEDGSIKIQEEDEKITQKKERGWANEQGKTLEEFKKKRENSKPIMVEKAVTYLLDKYLSDKFIILRSSKYDDYEHGVDNIIVDKETGEIVCGVDEVLSKDKEKDSSMKRKKVEKDNNKGGTKVKYGLGKNEDKLEIQTREKVNNFYLALNSNQLDSILKNLLNSSEASPQEEKEVVEELINSLEEQKKNLDTVSNSDFKYKRLEEMIHKMKQVSKGDEETRGQVNNLNI